MAGVAVGVVIDVVIDVCDGIVRRRLGFLLFRVNFSQFCCFFKWVGCGMKNDYCGVVNVLVFIVTGC